MSIHGAAFVLQHSSLPPPHKVKLRLPCASTHAADSFRVGAGYKFLTDWPAQPSPALIRGAAASPAWDSRYLHDVIFPSVFTANAFAGIAQKR